MGLYNTTYYIYTIVRVLTLKLYTLSDQYNSTVVVRQYPRVSFSRLVKSIFDTPSHIIDNLYLGNSYNASNYDILKENKFDIIINATDYIPNYFENDFTYKKYDIKDDENARISLILIDSYNYININNHKKIFVHCYAGASRSAAIILYYLMKRYNMSLDDANAFLLSKRDIVNINMNFINDIKKMI